MKVQFRKLDELVPAEKNVRIHNEKQIQEIAKSVSQFGVIRPIVIDENNMILAGNGLYESLKHLGHESAPTIQYVNLTENQKKKLMLSDNKVYSIGSDNFDVIDEFIREMGDDLDIAGFDKDLLMDLYMPNMDFELPDEDILEVESRIEQSVKYEQGDVQPSEDIQMQKQEAQTRKFVTCSHCGEKIYLD